MGGFAFSRNALTPAVVVDPATLRPESAAAGVFFGATVTYKDAAGLEHVVSIVGIDEVDLDRGYISWRSPLANALMKASPGDRLNLRARQQRRSISRSSRSSTRRFRWILSANR
jgi:transcription elongation factor GreB